MEINFYSSKCSDDDGICEVSLDLLFVAMKMIDFKAAEMKYHIGKIKMDIELRDCEEQKCSILRFHSSTEDGDICSEINYDVFPVEGTDVSSLADDYEGVYRNFDLADMIGYLCENLGKPEKYK